MATNEYKGRLTYIDGDGNQNVLYPMTSTDAVDGLSEELSAKQNALPTGSDGQILVYDNNGSLVASDNEALTTATSAAADAATALQRATLAMSEGSEAKSLAEDAGSAASKAQDTADLAYETAVQAEKAANDALEAIEENAITVDSALSDSSTNPVQNKVIKAALDEKATTTAVEEAWTRGDTAMTIAETAREEVAIAQARADEAYNLAENHEHSAGDIKSGTLSVERGGTGNTSVDTTPTSGSTKMVTSGGVYTALSGKANESHGNHVPATETADNAKFLRNDNTWQLVTPANIGAAPTGHASTGTGYGIGTGSNYGHVKLSDSTSSTSAASAGIAASPKAVKAAYDLANTANSAAATAQTAANNAATAASNAQTTADSKAPAYSYGTEDLTAGTSALETGKLHFVYE